MPLSISQFLDRLRESGVLSPLEMDGLAQKIPPEKRGHDAEKIAPKLVEANQLTPYQVAAILEGRQAALVLGDYVLLSKIGAGGMGQVFKARHRRMKRLVALKVLPPLLKERPEAIERFQREVEAAARLVHPNIVQAYDAGEHKGIHYLVMEYVSGDDLANVVRKQGPLPVLLAVDYVAQAARGLAHAHSNGIVHRDIKPANLLVDANGIVKILDMGLARVQNASEEEGPGLTQSGALMGTVDYIAPEQALDTKRADARADVYSLGCTLFHLLTGRPLYDGETMMMRLVAHREQPIPALLAERDDVPPALADVFERMVAKRPEHRFQDMHELSAALAACGAAFSHGHAMPSERPEAVELGSFHREGVSGSLGKRPPLPPPIPRNETYVGQTAQVTYSGELAATGFETGGDAPPILNVRRRKVWWATLALGVMALAMLACAPWLANQFPWGGQSNKGPPAASLDNAISSQSDQKTSGNGENAVRVVAPLTPVETILEPTEGGWGTLAKDLPTTEALLVGFDVTSGDVELPSAGGGYAKFRLITSIRPLYRTPRGDLIDTAPLLGTPTGTIRRLGNRPGYAVGAVNVKGAIYLDSMKVILMRIRGDHLDPKDCQTLESFGGAGGVECPTLGGDGKPSVGCLVRTGSGAVSALGLLQVQRTSQSYPAADGKTEP